MIVTLGLKGVSCVEETHGNRMHDRWEGFCIKVQYLSQTKFSPIVAFLAVKVKINSVFRHESWEAFVMQDAKKQLSTAIILLNCIRLALGHRGHNEPKFSDSQCSP